MLTISSIDATNQQLWTEYGRRCNADRPEYLPENMCWPDLESIVDDDGCICLIAEKGGAPAGRLMVRGEHLLEIAVAPGCRRQGIGTELLQCGARHAEARGVDTLRYFRYVDEEEEGLLTFFVNAGFSFHPSFSKEMDLTQGIPARVKDASEDLMRRGFTQRVVAAGSPEEETVCRLQQEYFSGFPGFMPAESMIRLMHRNGMMSILVEKDAEPAGFVLGGPGLKTTNYRHVRADGYGLLTSIAVVEEFRGQGVGTLLGYLLMAECERRGVTRFIYGGCQYWGRPSWKLATRLGGTRLLHHYGLVRRL